MTELTTSAGLPGPVTDGGERLATWWRRAVVTNLVAQVGIVVTGGLVRLTGSGLGCPSWPQCVPGSFTPVLRQAQGYHKDIEFGNRTLTGVVTLAAVGVLVTALLLRRAGRPVPLGPAAVPLLGVVVQALVGGVTVLTGLSPLTVAAHFLISMVLVAVSAWLALAPRPHSPSPPAARLAARAVAAAAVPVLVLGTLVTGSGPNAGDERTPRLGLDPQAVSLWHAGFVLVFLALVLALLVAVRSVAGTVMLRRRALGLLAVTLAQGGIGYLQFATGLPTLVVAAHLLGAALLVVAVTGVLSAA
jgi:heme a synthase